MHGFPLSLFKPILGDPGAVSGGGKKSKRAKKSQEGALPRVLDFSSPDFLSRPFRLFPTSTICPWVSEDVLSHDYLQGFFCRDVWLPVFMTRFLRTRCISLEMEKCPSSYQDQEIRTVVSSGCQVSTSPTVQFTLLECFFFSFNSSSHDFSFSHLPLHDFFVPAITFLPFYYL